MRSDNKNYKRRIMFNRLAVALVFAVIVGLIIFIIIAVNGKRDPGGERGAILTALPTLPFSPHAEGSAAVPTDGEQATPQIGTSSPGDLPELSPTAVPATERTDKQTDGPSATKTPEPPATDELPSGYTEISILNAGDIMCHMSQVRGAFVPETGVYDFSPTYRYVAPIVRNADLSVVNFETTLHDTDYSGYPGFNSPVGLLDAIKGAGFDTLLYANNHCFDRRVDGIRNTLKAFREYGFSYVGITDDPDAKPDKTLIIDVNGIRIGMINYTDSVTDITNGKLTLNDIPMSDDEWRYINAFINGREEEYLYPRAAEDVKRLKAAGADFIIAYMHWGVEYELTPNERQKECARRLCDMGVDCIIGSHPHVVQKMETVKSSDGSREIACFYSLGNYVSNQNRRTLPSYDAREYTENGLMVKLFVRKYSNGRTVLSKLEYIPTWVHRYQRSDGNYSHEIIPLPVPEGEEEQFGLTKTSFGVSDSRQSYERTSSVFRDAVDEFNAKMREKYGS